MGESDPGHRRCWFHVSAPIGPSRTSTTLFMGLFPHCSASHVVLRLVKKYPQYKIVNFDRLDYCACLKNLQEIKDAPNYKFVKGDIRSQDLVLYLFRTEEIDTVMHFAAQTHVGKKE